MNRLASPLARLSLASLALLLAIGCSTTKNQTPAGGTPGNDVTNSLDGGGDSGTTADTGANSDTSGQDIAAQPGDVTVADAEADVLADVAIVKVDGGPVTDAKVDTGDAKSDVKTDAKIDVPDTSKPAKCTLDTDCEGTGFGDCLGVGCNTVTGACESKAAADGKVCKVGGPCGASGICKQGACSFASSCGTQPCTPTPVKCGDTLTLQVGTFGASALSKYSCSGTVWDGGEKVLSLANDATSAVKATVTLSDDTSPTAALFDIGASAGVCSPSTCDVTGDKLVVGLPVGVSRTVIVDTLKGDGGTIKVTIVCEPITVCGDGTCNGTEKSATCPKDCGGLGTCGDGKCEDGVESCGSCPGDCGACPLECKVKSSSEPDAKGCKGCACEACVCAKDSYCCATAWDSACVSQCTKDCSGPKCATGICGDNKCDFATESSTTCPNDCVPTAKCGDGVCLGSPSSSGETCETCAQDCGVCAGAGPTCGDGKCTDGVEQCATCPQDCGVCDKVCGPQKIPGCGGCSCEKDVCAEDPYCCETAWDGQCVDECSFSDTPAKCPVDLCGDGICSGSEKCSDCAKDCGVCPPAAAVGCAGHCGSSSKDAKGGTCYCDSACTGAGDCCDDKVQFCGK